MKKLMTGALALAISISLAACSKTATNEPSTSSTDTTTTSASTDASGGTTSDTSTAPATGAPVDQSTPELAMTSWLNAMVGGDAGNVCRLMAIKGKTIESIPGAANACASKIEPMLAQIKQLGGAFEGLSIKGATVNGNSATFESVTTEPPMAADVVATFKAVKVGGKWYITEG
ncbi:hypothetical protein ACWEOW_20955 [Monashia sp. NPDC004114]